MVVQPYAPGDRNGVIALVLDIQQIEMGVPITLADQPDLDDVPAHYQRGRGGFGVAKDEGRVVGTVGLLDTGGEVALRKMFVERAYRGPVHATARRLLEKLLAHATHAGLARMFLGTRPEMQAAHRFYEKNGFVRMDESALPASFPRMRFDSLFYRIDLQQSGH